MRVSAWVALALFSASACNADSSNPTDSGASGAQGTGGSGSGGIGGDGNATTGSSGTAGSSGAGGGSAAGGSGASMGTGAENGSSGGAGTGGAATGTGGMAASGAGGLEGSGGAAAQGSGGSGGACDAFSQGSCADGDFDRCIDGSWEPGDCRPCELLSCGIECCERYNYFSAQINPWVDLPEIIGLVSIDDGAMTLEASFSGTNQLAAIGLRMNQTFNVQASTDLVVDYDVTGDVRVTVSLEDGESGCVFVMSGQVPNGSSPGCWDAFVGTPADAVLPTNIINVRIEALGAGAASLTLKSVTF
jgi:hypothetical protein